MTESLIRELFVSDVTRDIPPVVYFHEQSPEKLADEVSEYIITGGWPEGHPNHRRVPDGIHEQYVHLLKTISAELDIAGGPSLPNVWISGFYGSGKSSFAKLLGLSLDGRVLPGERPLASALLARDTSQNSEEFRKAWENLQNKLKPIAVVFDVGGSARDNEHVHSVVVRQVQMRLGYCSKNAHVAREELELERAGRWGDLERASLSEFKTPWKDLKDQPQAQARFSTLMLRLYPETYKDLRDWHMRHAGTESNTFSAEEAVSTIRDMLRFRAGGATLFIVVDEVSQYVLAVQDRVERLRAFASALGAGLKGRAWLLALGQQKLEEDADDSFLVKTKDRFPPRLRVHLAPSNIRDVVHRRLLQKKPAADAALRALFETHRSSLRCYAYGCESTTPDEFAEVYPLLPGFIELLLLITSEMRRKSSRVQGDDQAIRGLLQLLGELFREQRLAEKPVGSLVTLDQVYEIQHTALDADIQASMARILSQCAGDTSGLLIRVAKVVALLELIQDDVKDAPTSSTRQKSQGTYLRTSAELVAACLYDRVDRGNQVKAITEALEDLRARNLLGYSEKLGYKIQSSTGEEWTRERDDIGVARETVSEIIQKDLEYLMAAPERPRLLGRNFPWKALFSDGRRATDLSLVDPREDAVLCVDFQFLSRDERLETAWVKKSAESIRAERLVWVCGETDALDSLCRDLARSRAMVKKYEPRRESLNPARRLLLEQEKGREEEKKKAVREGIAACWMAGRMYHQGRSIVPFDAGASFSTALSEVANRILPDLFPQFIAISVMPGELMQLVEPELSGPSPKFLREELNILELDSGRYVATCGGVVPSRILEKIEVDGGIGGTSLLAHFGGPPFGYIANVVKACVAGLLRSSRIRIQPEGGTEITAVRDAGVRDLFEKDRAFRRAAFFPAEQDDIGFQERARICKFFEKHLNHRLDREDNAIADAVALLFPVQARRLRDTLLRYAQLPDRRDPPTKFPALQTALEECVAQSRQTRPTVRLVKRKLDTLSDGMSLLNVYDPELTAEVIQAVRAAAIVRDYHLRQLEVAGLESEPVKPAGARVKEHLSTECPWRDIAALADDLRLIRRSYFDERGSLLEWQERLAEKARAQVKAREGFETLTAEQSHRVLLPINRAQSDTTADATAPELIALKDPFMVALTQAIEESNEILDEILSEGKLVVKVDLRLRNRELSTAAEIDALLEEIRTRLMRQIMNGARVRLV